MFKLLRSLEGLLWPVLAIIVLLVVQAYCDLALPQYMSDIVDIGITRRGMADVSPLVIAEQVAAGVDFSETQMSYILQKGAAMLAFTLVMVAAAALVGLLAARSGSQVGLQLRDKVFKKTISFSNAELDKFTTASLITRSTNDIQQVQMAAIMVLRIVFFAPILGIGGVIKVSGTQSGMGWIIGVALGVITTIVVILIAVAMPKFKQAPVLMDKLNLVSREILTGVSVIRAFGRERHEEKRFEQASAELRDNQLFTSRVMAIMMPAMMMIMNLITLGIVWFGAQGVDMGRLLVGDLMAFIAYTMQIVMAFLMLTIISVMLPRAIVSAKRVNEILETDSSIHDPEEAAVYHGATSATQGVVCFEDVSFRYPGADEDAVSGISFTARPGETTAIIGSTGCGKSTLLHLLMRFYDVSGGKITLDGRDIRQLRQSDLRAQMGFVPQKGLLFSGDIASNIAFAGDHIDDTRMREAAHIAQAEDFIAEKAEQYASIVSQGGSNVSGGQRQRLSIARAIAGQTPIFLFDDSFSALDYKTDVALRRALGEAMRDSTVIIVAQRVGTILHADQIIVLDEGEIAAIGKHEELMEHCGIYQEIAGSQLGGQGVAENSSLRPNLPLRGSEPQSVT